MSKGNKHGKLVLSKMLHPNLLTSGNSNSSRDRTPLGLHLLEACLKDLLIKGPPLQLHPRIHDALETRRSKQEHILQKLLRTPNILRLSMPFYMTLFQLKHYFPLLSNMKHLLYLSLIKKICFLIMFPNSHYLNA